jgi:hypothetical protein
VSAILPGFGTPMGEVARGALVLAGFYAIVLAAELWHRRAHPPTEWTRKLVHFGAGLLACAFPWWLDSPWTLLAVAAIGGAPIFVARARGGLQSIFGVERRSFGDVYFPIAIFILFAIGRHAPVFYVVALLTLVVADALAAVLGRAYGKHRYRVTTEQRSLEGSVVFLVVTFLVVHLPLLLATHIDRGACVLMAVQIALLVGSFEAIGTQGSDNLFVPLGTYYLLLKLTPKPIEAIVVQILVQIAILVLMLWVSRRTRFFSFSGAIAAHLMLYAAFSLGGPAWVVAPALALSVAMVLEQRRVSRMHHPASADHDVAVIFYVSAVAVLLIFADNTFSTSFSSMSPRGHHPFLGLYVGSLAGAIGIVAYLGLESAPRVRHRSPAWRALASGLIGFGVVAPLGLWASRGVGERVGIEFGTAALLCAAAMLAFLGLRRGFARPPGTGWNLRYLALAVLAATLAIMPLHFHWIRSADWALR